MREELFDARELSQHKYILYGNAQIHEKESFS